jgi:hypothetical protein
MSLGGANLEVESQTGIPDSFDLVIDVEQSNQHCHVVWRKARRIGVVFDYLPIPLSRGRPQAKRY